MKRATLEFRFDWRLALLVGLLLPTMVRLGFWQLQRADENSRLLLQAEQQAELEPVRLSTGLVDELVRAVNGGNVDRWHRKPVLVSGEWLPQAFMLENQLHDGANGYHVITVLGLEDGRRVLVNRGWVRAPQVREQMPEVPAPASERQERAHWYLAGHMMEDGELFAEAGWPRRIGRLSIPAVERELGYPLIPALLRLEPASPSALTAQWPVVNIAPEKNTAYAVQWFAMSAALVVCYLAFSIRRKPLPAPQEDYHG